MPFQVSPGVNVREIDLTTIVPAVATTTGAIAGVFGWGPVNERTLVDTEVNLVNQFGKPSNFNAETWFTAANFLGYGNSLYVVRSADVTANTVTASEAGDDANTVAFNSFVAVANTTDFITILSNPFSNTDAVVYTTDDGKTALSGLANGETYYVVQANSTGIKLATEEDGTAINIAQTVTVATFNAESSVDDGNEFITISSNPFINGDAIVYSTDAGNTALTGLSNNGLYYVVQSNTTGIKLSLTVGGSAIDITAGSDENGHNLASGSGHNLTREEEFVARGDSQIIRVATDGIVNGMILLYSNSSAVVEGSTVTVVNSSHVELSDAAVADARGIELVFRENIPFTAIAQEGTREYSIDWDSYIVQNKNQYETLDEQGEIGSAATDSVRYVAKYPGEIGNSLRISVCDSEDQYYKSINLRPNSQIDSTSSDISATVGSNTLLVTITPANTASNGNVTAANGVAGRVYENLIVGDLIEVGNNRIGFQTLKVTEIGEISLSGSNVFTISISTEDEYKLSSDVSLGTIERFWEFHNSVDSAPGQSAYVAAYGNTAAADELHAVIVDEGGKVTGSPGTILEVYRNLSRASDAKSVDGATIFYKDVINQSSKYVWWTSDRDAAASETAQFVRSSTETLPLSVRMFGGADGPNEVNVPFSTLAFGYDMFKSAEDVDISLILQGKARGLSISNYTQLGNYLIDNIAEDRKDCVVFISPDKADVVNNHYGAGTDIVNFRNDLRSTSYAVLDSGYKYMYDRYNDVYRWVPLNGDVAGLCARTDSTNDPWWSPAGLNRGQIKNIIKLAYNPRKADRDLLYKNGINPVVTFPAQGTILYGDKTLLSKPSAFDRINVRRLFIVLEKAISTASKYTLFEFNDAFTRSQFKNLIIPYLRDVQGRRGITDFLVVCDETNNTPEVIDRNEFIGDIYIKPARAINFIQLNFVAVRTGVSFSEVVGKF